MVSHTIPLRTLQKLPSAWKAQLALVSAERIRRGMSGAKVWRLRTTPERYLKIAEVYQWFAKGRRMLKNHREQVDWRRENLPDTPHQTLLFSSLAIDVPPCPQITLQLAKKKPDSLRVLGWNDPTFTVKLAFRTKSE